MYISSIDKNCLFFYSGQVVLKSTVLEFHIYLTKVSGRVVMGLEGQTVHRVQAGQQQNWHFREKHVIFPHM